MRKGGSVCKENDAERRCVQGASADASGDCGREAHASCEVKLEYMLGVA